MLSWAGTAERARIGTLEATVAAQGTVIEALLAERAADRAAITALAAQIAAGQADRRGATSAATRALVPALGAALGRIARTAGSEARWPHAFKSTHVLEFAQRDGPLGQALAALAVCSPAILGRLLGKVEGQVCDGWRIRQAGEGGSRHWEIGPTGQE